MQIDKWIRRKCGKKSREKNKSECKREDTKKDRNFRLLKALGKGRMNQRNQTRVDSRERIKGNEKSAQKTNMERDVALVKTRFT